MALSPAEVIADTTHAASSTSGTAARTCDGSVRRNQALTTPERSQSTSKPAPSVKNTMRLTVPAPRVMCRASPRPCSQINLNSAAFICKQTCRSYYFTRRVRTADQLRFVRSADPTFHNDVTRPSFCLPPDHL